MLVQLRDKLVADGEGLNEPEANTKHPIGRGCGGPPESSSRGMQEEIRRRTWEAPALLAVGRSNGGYIVTKARKGKPGHGVKREPKRGAGKPCGKAEEYCETESPPDVPEESYQA